MAGACTVSHLRLLRSTAGHSGRSGILGQDGLGLRSALVCQTIEHQAFVFGPHGSGHCVEPDSHGRGNPVAGSALGTILNLFSVNLDYRWLLFSYVDWLRI